MVARLFGSLVPLPGLEVTVCVTVAPPMGLLGPVALGMRSEKEKSFSGPGEQALRSEKEHSFSGPGGQTLRSEEERSFSGPGGQPWN